MSSKLAISLILDFRISISAFKASFFLLAESFHKRSLNDEVLWVQCIVNFSPELVDLVRQLLVVNPSSLHRNCCTNYFEDESFASHVCSSIIDQ